jgi:hypothetical protein
MHVVLHQSRRCRTNAVRIYLAGKMDSNWRSTIVSGFSRNLSLPQEPIEEWPVLEKAIFEVHDFVGPYRMQGHGGALTERFEDADQGHRLDSSGSDSLLNPDWNVPRLCRKAIETADLFFAWIDGLDAFATLLELGFALGRVPEDPEDAFEPKEVVLASPPGAFTRRHPDGCLCFQGHACLQGHEGALSQLWFLPGFMDTVRDSTGASWPGLVRYVVGSSPEVALRRALNDLTLPPFGGPIEEQDTRPRGPSVYQRLRARDIG